MTDEEGIMTMAKIGAQHGKEVSAYFLSQLRWRQAESRGGARREVSDFFLWLSGYIAPPTERLP